MKNNSTINNKIPQLRFPGFTGDWEEKSLGEVGVFVRGLSYNKGEVTQNRAATLVLRSNNIIQDGVVDCRNGLQFVTKEPSSEQILQKGDIVICLSNGSSNLVGKSANYEGDYAGIATVGAFCGIYRSTAPITKYLVQTPAYKKSVELIKQGGNGALANLYGRDILGLKFYFPTLEEQNEIVECLEAEDRLISAQEQKVEFLKAHKKGLMQQLFPQPGATTPALRFPGYSGEWEEKTFGELYKKNNIKNDLSFGIDKIISVANMYFKADANIGDKEYLKSYNVFRLGDIAYEGNKSANYAYGRFVENTIGDGIVSHVFDVYSPISKDHCFGYWKYAINYERIMRPVLEKSTIKSTMMTNLIAKDFLKQKTLVPTPAEQQKIAECLEAEDRMISVQEQKVESLKTHKKGLMQQLFPQPEK